MLSRPLWLALSILLCLAAPAFGGTYQIYAKFGTGTGTYAGEVTTPKTYAGWVYLDTFSFGLGNPNAGTSSSKVSAYPLATARPVDRLSPLFLQLICTGATVGGSGATTGVTVDYVRNDTGLPMLRLEYAGCYVTNVQSGATSGSTATSEGVSIVYTKLTMTYYQADGSTGPKYSYDFPN